MKRGSILSAILHVAILLLLLFGIPKLVFDSDDEQPDEREIVIDIEKDVVVAEAEPSEETKEPEEAKEPEDAKEPEEDRRDETKTVDAAVPNGAARARAEDSTEGRSSDQEVAGAELTELTEIEVTTERATLPDIPDEGANVDQEGRLEVEENTEGNPRREPEAEELEPPPVDGGEAEEPSQKDEPSSKPEAELEPKSNAKNENWVKLSDIIAALEGTADGESDLSVLDQTVIIEGAREAEETQTPPPTPDGAAGDLEVIPELVEEPVRADIVEQDSSKADAHELYAQDELSPSLKGVEEGPLDELAQPESWDDAQAETLLPEAPTGGTSPGSGSADREQPEPGAPGAAEAAAPFPDLSLAESGGHPEGGLGAGSEEGEVGGELGQPDLGAIGESDIVAEMRPAQAAPPDTPQAPTETLELAPLEPDQTADALDEPPPGAFDFLAESLIPEEAPKTLEELGTQIDALLADTVPSPEDLGLDRAEMLETYRRSARSGFVESQYIMGELYARGEIVPRDLTQAAGWLGRAAEKKYVDSQLHYGYLYASGQGVERDLAQAHLWWSLAAQAGDILAKRGLALIEGQMTPEQRFESEKQQIQWRQIWSNWQRFAKLNIPEIDAELIAAARAGEVDEVKRLLDQGADVNSRDAQGRSALLWSAINSHGDVAVALLGRGADPNVADRNGKSALMWAADNGDETTVKSLLKKDIDVNARDVYGETALINAAWSGRTRIVEILLVKGAIIDLRDDYGATALIWSAINGHADVARMLAGRGAQIDARDDDGLTALMRAAWNGRSDVVRLLLAVGADPGVTDDEGRTALALAEGEGNSEIVELLTATTSAPD